MALRLEAMGQAKYAGTAKRTKSDGRAVFTGKVNLDHAALEIPLGWKHPRRIFVNSMSDLFHEAVPDQFICDVFTVMQQAHWHTFQVLTKRPERMADLLSRFHGARPFAERYPNVWCGASVEHQAAADERIPRLLRVPARIRFLSCEPLLGPVILQGDGEYDNPHAMRSRSYLRGVTGDERIHWLIVGGESGHGARPMHPDWARSLRDQAQAADVAFFFKQWGAWAPGQTPEIRAARPRIHMAPNGETEPVATLDRAYEAAHAGMNALLYRVGKHAAGRLLDGCEWNEVPA
jgi:protein gp37